jgi:Leucine-rich repeat (LRR) protein
MLISLGLKHLTNLEELYATNNHITSVDGVKSLKYLKLLDVKENFISAIAVKSFEL